MNIKNVLSLILVKYNNDDRISEKVPRRNTGIY